jgi:signal transduction histidine kinase
MEINMTPAAFSQCLGTVAHELRNPIANSISGVRVIASECKPDPFAGPILAGVENELLLAMRLVDDLFDLCAGSLGKLSIQKETVGLEDVIARATEMARHELEARQHRLTISLPRESLPLEADPARLAQVLTNLLCNAAKFTNPGGDIRLSAAAENGQVVLRVRDNGRGIAPDQLPRIFELFQQSPGRAGGGLGIGLAVVKSLVELHGGTVTAHSDGPGTGSEFIVRLPTSADQHRWPSCAAATMAHVPMVPRQSI